jgi:MarR family transcriptional regulator, organic hydroperoxide resistance regulator
MNPSPWDTEGMLDLYRSILQMLLRSTLQEWFALDMTLAQIKVLFLLDHEASASVGTVAQMIGISVPTASQLIDRLVQAGSAQRVERMTDRRYTEVSLTLEGKQLVQRLRQGHTERLRSWLASLNEEEQVQLRAGLLALARLAQLPLPIPQEAPVAPQAYPTASSDSVENR